VDTTATLGTCRNTSKVLLATVTFPMDAEESLCTGRTRKHARIHDCLARGRGEPEHAFLHTAQ
jgi:hypothetical protein